MGNGFGGKFNSSPNHISGDLTIESGSITVLGSGNTTYIMSSTSSLGELTDGKG